MYISTSKVQQKSTSNNKSTINQQVQSIKSTINDVIKGTINQNKLKQLKYNKKSTSQILEKNHIQGRLWQNCGDLYCNFQSI